jgi:hypothetical protein
VDCTRKEIKTVRESYHIEVHCPGVSNNDGITSPHSLSTTTTTTTTVRTTLFASFSSRCHRKLTHLVDAYHLSSTIAVEVSPSTRISAAFPLFIPARSVAAAHIGGGCQLLWESFVISSLVGIVSLGDNVSYELVRPILESCSAGDLRRLEDATPVSRPY